MRWSYMLMMSFNACCPSRDALIIWPQRSTIVKAICLKRLVDEGTSYLEPLAHIIQRTPDFESLMPYRRRIAART
jgi:hypothetical protein